MNELFRDLFIFEMANNHQGSLEHGLRIIREMGRIARRHQVKGVIKFQYRDLDTLVHPAFRDRKDVKHVPRFYGTRLSKNDYQIMIGAARDEGLLTACTPFDEPSVGVVLDHGIDIMKVASCSATDWPLLETVARARRPTIVSTGGKTLLEIDNIVSFFSHRGTDFALLHCVGLYPTPEEQLQFSFLDRMRRRYSYLPVGYSGHEAPDNLDAAKLAVAKGAEILERHVGVPTDAVKLNDYSSNPEQVDRWVAAAQGVRRMCGSPMSEKRITQGEIDALLELGRGTYALKEIRQGGPIGRQDVFFAMPCHEGQTSSGEFQEGMVASRDYPALAQIQELRPPSLINLARSVIHDAKGMLYEARIHIGEDFEIELSHHYGLEHFRQTGALIVNLINRAYCKKLVVMLPGQRHPNHHHRVKEETFHVLWGDFEVNLDGTLVCMKPGDKLLVERNAWHSFFTRGGAIVEEVSTTHVKGDSYYEDERIARRDLIERKTVVEDW